MIGVVIPAHDEAAHIGATLRAVRAAAAHPRLAGEAVRVLVVLDACSDATGRIARAHGVETLAVRARNVGRARAAGAARLLARGARWLACTDADTQVAPDWLAAQLALAAAGYQAVCGTVQVRDWRPHGARAEALRLQFQRHYRDADGHRHVHGANLGVCAAAYRKAGGFAPQACSEDRALVAALQASGARIAWSAEPRVVTSARTRARARGGFGDTLLALRAEVAAGAG